MKKPPNYKYKLKENDIQRTIKNYLQVLENQGKLMFIRNNSGAMPVKGQNGKMRYIKFGKKGSADILVWKPSAEWDDLAYRGVNVVRAIALEVKSSIGKISPAQKEWQEKFEKLGGEYYIVRSVEEVMKIVVN